jgi:membrane protein implicated in regulation of membrane protease activity
MSPNFVTTKSPEKTPNNLHDRLRAEALSKAFAIVGKMIAEGWINVDFDDETWPLDLRAQTQAVAEVLYDYQ